MEKPKLQNQWDLDRLKQNTKFLIYAYVKDQIHSIFVCDAQDDDKIVLDQCKELSPPITKIVKKNPTSENWTFVEKHYDDLGYDTRIAEQAMELFNKGKIIVNIPAGYVTRFANAEAEEIRRMNELLHTPLATLLKQHIS